MSEVSPILSVIVPVYKAEKYLSECVDSLCRQTLHDIEIILVDDGSPDACPLMCDEFAAGDSRIVVIHKDNGGPGIARNTGLSIARGRWVCFVDSDDFIALNTFETCVSIAERYHTDQVRFLLKSVPYDYDSCAQVAIVNDKDGVLCKSFDEKVSPIIEAVANIPFGAHAKSSDSACTAIFRRSMLVENKLEFRHEDEIVVEDYAFILEVAPKCDTIVYTSNCFYFYRDTPCSRSKYRSDRMDRSAEISLYLEKNLPKYGYKDVSLISTAVMLGYLRVFLREIYDSDMSPAEKRKAHYEAVNHPYIHTIAKGRDYKRLTKIQRMAFYFRDSYVISRMLVSGRDLLREFF